MGAGFRTVAVVSGVLLGVVVVAPVGTAQEEAGGSQECFVVADGSAYEVDGGSEDLLTRVDRLDPDPATNETDVGSGTGSFFIEAIAFQPATGALFAADAGVLGTLDLDTGRFTELGEVGTGSGELGRVELDDIDGLTFDPATGFLYGTARRSGEDLLLRLDPATGAVVEGAVGGADYGVVAGVEGLRDIDDIAIDPSDGQMYAVANDDGRDDRLVRIDKATGAATDIGPMQAEDVEGLGFAGDQLIGTTGKVHGREGLWDVDKSTGAADNRRPLDNGQDYEAFDCFNPPTPPAAPLSCLVVSVDAVPDDPVDFPFALTGETLPAEVILDDDPGSDTPSTVEYCQLPAGAYTVTEQTPPGWALVSVSCSDPGGGAVAATDGPEAAVELGGGETVTCLYRNIPLEVEGPRQAGGVAGTPAPAPAPAPAPPEPEPEAPAPAEAPALAGAAASAGPEALAELPRTGRDRSRPLMLLGGVGLALGGLGVVGSTRRPVRR